MDFDILKRAHCTDEEKTELLNTISLMSDIADKSYGEGLLSLEDVVDVTDNKFLKIAIKIIIDVSDKDFLRDVLENIINAEECDGRILLEKILILEAAMLIIQHSSGEAVKTILLSLLGEKWVSAYIDEEFYSFSDKNIELAAQNFLYWSLLNSLKKLLKSHWFLYRLASIYLLGEIEELDKNKINESAEQVWIIVNEHITSKFFAWEHFSISFAWYTRIQILEKLLNLMNNCDYISFHDNAEFALKRVLSLYEIDKEKISDMRYEFTRRINEFMKLVMIIVMNNHRKCDFKILSRAISKTIMAGEKAMELKVEFSKIIEEML